MKSLLLPVCLVAFPLIAQTQIVYTTANIHSHNDYHQAVPFLNAYAEGVGSIEADVFEKDGKLYVAHEAKEVTKGHTLDSMYLKPLAEKIKHNKGAVYTDKKKKLQFMIDLKTPGIPTLDVLVKELARYPQIIQCSSLTITISGSIPTPAQWAQYPTYIHFDSHPHVKYTPEEFERVAMMSTSFSEYSDWKGEGPIPPIQLDKIKETITTVHAQGKPFRFWGTPDNANAWKTFMELGVDYLNTDKVSELAKVIRAKK